MFVVYRPRAHKIKALERQNHRCVRCGDWLILKDARFIGGLPKFEDVEGAELAHDKCCR